MTALWQGCCMVVTSLAFLYGYTSNVPWGFSTYVHKQLTHAASMHTLIYWQKSVIPLLDKTYITENLVYNKHTGTLIGFTDLGEVNEHSLRFKRDINNISHIDKPLVNQWWPSWCEALSTSLQIPYAQFRSASICGELLFGPFWEAVYHLERCGFKILYFLFAFWHCKIFPKFRILMKPQSTGG